jgi:hypothetical protein
MRCCEKPVRLIFTVFLTLLLMACGEDQVTDFGFSINRVDASPAYRSVNVRMRQKLELSPQAQSALEHGVTLTIELELEVRTDTDTNLVRREAKRYQLRYLPLSERYQLSSDVSRESQVFPRLRHALAAIGESDLRLETGPLAPGGYELRTRIHLDWRSLPAPMLIPAWFSSSWRHDSEWSVWPFKVNA